MVISLSGIQLRSPFDQPDEFLFIVAVNRVQKTAEALDAPRFQFETPDRPVDEEHVHGFGMRSALDRVGDQREFGGGPGGKRREVNITRVAAFQGRGKFGGIFAVFFQVVVDEALRFRQALSALFRLVDGGAFDVGAGGLARRHDLGSESRLTPLPERQIDDAQQRTADQHVECAGGKPLRR